MQVEHVQLPEVVGFFIPAALQSNAFTGGGTGFGASTLLFRVGRLKSNEGGEDFGTDFTFSIAFKYDGVSANVNVAVTEKINVGNASTDMASATSFGVFLGTSTFSSFTSAACAAMFCEEDTSVSLAAGAGTGDEPPGSG
jgi:hypothetical protein